MPFSAQISRFLHQPLWLKTLVFIGLVALLFIAWPLAVAMVYALIVWQTMRQPATRYALASAMIIPALFMQFTWAKAVIAGFSQPSGGASTQVAQVSPTPSTNTNRVQSATDQSVEKVKVLQAVSGDTIDVDQDGQPYRVKLIGLIAPAMVAKDTGKAECFGPEAQMFLDSLLRGRSVKLQADSQMSNSDKSVVLRYLTMDDGTQVNQLMLEAGLARPDTSIDYQSLPQYKAYAEAAKAAKKGLWLNCDKPATTPTPSKSSPTTTPTPSLTPTPGSTTISPIPFDF